MNIPSIGGSSSMRKGHYHVAGAEFGERIQLGSSPADSLR